MLILLGKNSIANNAKQSSNFKTKKLTEQKISVSHLNNIMQNKYIYW